MVSSHLWGSSLIEKEKVKIGDSANQSKISSMTPAISTRAHPKVTSLSLMGNFSPKVKKISLTKSLKDMFLVSKPWESGKPGVKNLKSKVCFCYILSLMCNL